MLLPAHIFSFLNHRGMTQIGVPWNDAFMVSYRCEPLSGLWDGTICHTFCYSRQRDICASSRVSRAEVLSLWSGTLLEASPGVPSSPRCREKRPHRACPQRRGYTCSSPGESSPPLIKSCSPGFLSARPLCEVGRSLPTSRTSLTQKQTRKGK